MWRSRWSRYVATVRESRSGGRWILVVAVLLAACGDADEPVVRVGADVSASTAEPATTSMAAPTSTSSGTTSIVPATSAPEVSPLRLVCDGVLLPGNDPSLPGLPVSGPDEDSGWDAAVAKYGVDLRGDLEWRVLNKTPDDLQLIADALPGGEPSGTFTIATFTREGDGWAPGALSSCAARWGREGLLNVDTVEVDPSNRPSDDSTSLHLVVVDDRSPCGFGDPGSAVALVDESTEFVSIVVLVEPAPADTQVCSGELVPITVALAGPLGERVVVDGSTVPARPLTVFRSEQRLNIVVVGSSVAGWWDADAAAWVDSEPVTPAIPLAPGTRLQVVSLRGAQAPVVAGSPVRDCEPAGTWTVSLEPQVDSSADTLGVDGTWPLLPRAVTVLSSSIPDYEQAVSEFLAQRGLVDVPVAVNQVIRVDLDGDAIDEVLVSAHHPDATNALPAQAGHFSVVLLRRIAGAEVDTVALFEDLHPAADTELPTMLIGGVSAIGDLNGDSMMEIAVKSRSFEGSNTDIYDTAGGAPSKVLSVSCSS